MSCKLMEMVWSSSPGVSGKLVSVTIAEGSESDMHRKMVSKFTAALLTGESLTLELMQKNHMAEWELIDRRVA